MGFKIATKREYWRGGVIFLLMGLSFLQMLFSGNIDEITYNGEVLQRGDDGFLYAFYMVRFYWSLGCAFIFLASLLFFWMSRRKLGPSRVEKNIRKLRKSKGLDPDEKPRGKRRIKLNSDAKAKLEKVWSKHDL